MLACDAHCLRLIFFIFLEFSQIIDWLNECNEGGKTPAERCEAIKKTQELIVHSEEELLEEFLENILAFSHDAVQSVRCCVVGFVEEIS